MKKALLQLKGIAGYYLPVLVLFVFMNIYRSNAQTQCGPVSFPAPAEIVANVPEASGYNLVYHLPIPAANSDWNSQAEIPYSENNTAALSPIPYTRVAYYVKLYSTAYGAQWVWVSFDAHTTNINDIGLPTGATIWQQIVKNMNVVNYAGINKKGIDGNIEFWSHCYLQNNAAAIPGASDADYDFGDTPNLDVGENCYGSFQVHDFADKHTLFAYNGWSYPTSDACDDLGINNQSTASPDWTLSNNSCTYDVRELYIFVNATPCPPTSGHFYLTEVDCSGFLAGASTLESVCYKIKDNAVSNAVPGMFFYYTKVVAPAVLGPNNSFCVDVVQTKNCDGFKNYAIHQGNQIRAWDINCGKVASGTEVSAGNGRVCISGATPGQTYVISVKYEPKSLIGSTWPGTTPPTCENSFVASIAAPGSAFGSGVAVAGSQGVLQARPNCEVTVVPPVQQLVSDPRVGRAERLTVTVLSNPAVNHFTLNLLSNNTQPVTVRILDMYGRVMIVKDRVAVNSTLQIGESLTRNTYFAEIIQGTDRKIIKLVKAN